MSLKALPFILIIFLAVVAFFRVILFDTQVISAKRKVSFIVQVLDSPEIRTDKQVLHVQLNQTDHELKKGSRITLYARNYPLYNYGDILEINANTLNHNILFVTQSKKIGHQDVYLISDLLKVKSIFEQNVRAALPEPYSTIGLGMVVGTSKKLPEKTEQIFKDTGTIHMLVISGFNITLIAGSVLKLSGLLHRKIAIPLAIASAAMFVLLTGAQPPALRAGIMASIALLAQFFGKPVQASYLVLLSALLMIAVDPRLVTSLSYQLSFLATLGIILIEPQVSNLLKLVVHRKTTLIQKIYNFLISEVALTISAQIAVLPLILYNFGTLSLISPLANLLTGWVVPYIMYSVLLTGVLGAISVIISKVIAISSYIFTAYFLHLNYHLSDVPFASISEIKINLWILLGIYLVYAAIIIKMQEHKKYSKSQENL